MLKRDWSGNRQCHQFGYYDWLLLLKMAMTAVDQMRWMEMKNRQKRWPTASIAGRSVETLPRPIDLSLRIDHSSTPPECRRTSNVRPDVIDNI